MNKKYEALRMAIEAMETCDIDMWTFSAIDIALALAACKAALSEPEQVDINPCDGHYQLVTIGESEQVSLPKIDYNADMDRYYIPMPAGWEMQTKGKGSSFRLCDTKTGERYHVLDERLQPVLEQMAREMHEASKQVSLPDGWVAVPVEPTADMLKSTLEVHCRSIDNFSWTAMYKAMLQAAPKLNEKG